MNDEHKIDLTFVVNATYRSQKIVRGYIDMARNFETDPKKEERISKGECMPCFYIPYMAGQGFTDWMCLSCGKIDKHSNTKVPVLCLECSKKHKLCVSCGGDINLKMRRKLVI